MDTEKKPPVEGGASNKKEEASKNNIVVKVAMVGDSQIGKTSLMGKYGEGTFDEDYIQTLGIPHPIYKSYRFHRC